MTYIPLKQKFTTSLYWNLLDSVGTQAVLLVHHFLVRNYMSISFHGIYGTLLSLFYLAIILVNIGFDYSLIPFYKQFTQNRSHARTFISYYLIPQWLLVLTVSGLAYFNAQLVLDFLIKLIPACKNPTDNYLTLPIISLIALSFITESIKKTVKYMLQLDFYVELTAIVEFFGMLVYTTLIWQNWLLGKPIHFALLWTIFAGVSALQCVILWIAFFYHMAYNVPLENNSEPLNNFAQRVTVNRFSVYINQIIGQLFSSNFLVPICAFYMTINQASYVKIMSSLAQWITLIAQKVFGVSANALLAQTKLYSDKTHRAIFSYVSSYFYQALIFLIIFLMINGKKLIFLQLSSAITITHWSAFYALLGASLIEGFLLLYQNWYTFEEKAYLVSGINIFCGLLFLIFIYTIPALKSSLMLYFLLIIALRFLTLLCLGIFSHYRWDIKPDLSIKLPYFITILLISFFCFLILS
jgi:hypothetical protein